MVEQLAQISERMQALLRQMRDAASLPGNDELVGRLRQELRYLMKTTQESATTLRRRVRRTAK